MLNVPVTMLLQLIRGVSGSKDKDGTCHCVVHLPNNPIYLQQLEQLQRTTQELMGKYEQELSRVSAGAEAGAGVGWGCKGHKHNLSWSQLGNEPWL